MALEEETLGAGAEPAEPLAPAAPVVSGPMAPVAAAERIELIDVLRGAALFGILAANARALGGPWNMYGSPELLFPGFADRFVQGLIDVFVSSKFLSLFSFLFGLGFAVQMTRAEERGARVRSFYPRRLLILFAFGIVHGALLFWGDILTAYALMGFVLLLFRKRRPITMVRWAIAVPLVLTIAVSTAFLVFQFVTPPREDHAKELAEAARIAAAFRNADFIGVVAENFLSWVSFVVRNLSVVMLLPAFLFGLWVWRQGIPQDPGAHMAAIRRTCRIALPLGIVLNTVAVAENILRGGMRPFPPDAVLFVASISRIYGMYILALGYAAGLVLLMQRHQWRRRLAPAAAVGRMALTNYLLQSLVAVVFFTTTNLYGRMGPALLLIPTVAIYAVQVWLSNWWMGRFRYGPMEWLWRTLTYGRIGPLRREAAQPVGAAA